MSKIFRLHPGGSNAINGWNISAQYNSNIINSIEDPAAAKASREITSIPSPFARMDLVKKAFDFVNRNGIDGNTIHHKMVSHALDVAQIFFNYDNYKNAGLIDLIKWDENDLDLLTGSRNQSHELLGRTLDLFMKSDSGQFNFDRMRGLYMIRYIGPDSPSIMTILGSTSPASLFYTSANKFDFLKGKITFGNHQALGMAGFQSLKDRHDENFIAWFYALKAAMPGFPGMFPEVDAYLAENYRYLNHRLQQRISSMDLNTLTTDFTSLDITPGVPVEILGTQLSKSKPIDIGLTSDFAIRSERVNEFKPLVLPSNPFAQPWIYTTAPWDQCTDVPLNPGDIDRRALPRDGRRYPYLTMTDFLEDSLIQAESKPNRSDFFDGNLVDNTGGDHSFLLPIKRKYFEYFTIEDLKRDLSMVCDPAPGGGLSVKVSLKIPVTRGVITFERHYISNSSNINPKNGTILTKDFTLVLYPRTKFPQGVTPNYVVGMMTKSLDWKPSIECIKDDSTRASVELGPVDRNKDGAGQRVVKYAPIMPMSLINGNFDIIDVSDSGIHGIAVPLWGGTVGGATYEFAVDFGTTNTHIEYKVNGGNPKPLDIFESGRQLATFNEDALNAPDYALALKENAVPSVLGTDGDTHFPMRTLLSYKKATVWSTPTAPFITGNMPFHFGVQLPSSYNEIKSDLKWSNDRDITSMIECYLGSLMLIMRNKVVMEGGALKQTKILWFYPTSMPGAQVARISQIWTKLFNKYIGGASVNLKLMPESMAPYNFYRNTFGAGVDVLTIDIGGGTSDALIINSNGKPSVITSFRFAANSLLGDGFIANGLNNNGFVNKFRPIINSILVANGRQNTKDVLDFIAGGQKSADFINQLFYLKDNPDHRDFRDKVDFMSILQDSEGAKTLVLIFYTAIIYHLALLIKAKREQGQNVQEPAVLAFSGNGSKLLQVLGVNTQVGKDLLSKFTVAIFEKVNKRPYPHSTLKLAIDPEKPKEATCKGGLCADTIPNLGDIESMNTTLLGTSPDRFVNDEKYEDLQENEFNDLNDIIVDFTNTFFELAKEQKIKANFGTIDYVDLDKHKGLFINGTKSNTKNALLSMKLLDSQSPIEETLFFYPITQTLNDLATQIL